MKPRSAPTKGPSLEHALTTMGVVVALAGLLSMLASAFGWSSMDALMALRQEVSATSVQA